MPSHQERVRRSYHAIALRADDRPLQYTWTFQFSVTREELASWAGWETLRRALWEKLNHEGAAAFGGMKR